MVLRPVTALPAGVYNAERGLSIGGLNEEANPVIGEGGLNED